MVPIISRFTSASNSRMPLLADYHKNTLKKQSYCTTNFSVTVACSLTPPCSISLNIVQK